MSRSPTQAGLWRQALPLEGIATHQTLPTMMSSITTSSTSSTTTSTQMAGDSPATVRVTLPSATEEATPPPSGESILDGAARCRPSERGVGSGIAAAEAPALTPALALALALSP